MKIKRFFTSIILILFFGVILSPKVFSQEGNKTINAKDSENLPLYNLFYLSKYITANNLTPEQADQVYNTLLSSIDTTSAYKISTEYRQMSKTLKEKNPIGSFLNNRKIQKQQLKKNIINEFTTGNFKNFDGQNTNLKEAYDSLLKDDSINKCIAEKERLKKIKDLINSPESPELTDALQNLLTKKIKDLSAQGKLTETDIDQSIKEIEATLEQNKKKNDTYLANVKTYADNYIKKQNLSIHDPKIFFSNDAKFATTEIQINSVIQNAEQRSATTSFSIPNESDMIKAMAIFLAKRAQQETAIWFMDQLRNNLNNPLIYEAFPETIKLIESLEDYKTPNFSIAWRYAISSDFIKMPKNLADGNWVKNIVFNNDPKKAALFTTCIDFAYDLNRLISEKYNYRDIVRYFYTNQKFAFNTNSQGEVQNSITSSISALYILTNEFFAVDLQEGKENFRLLSYEEINSLTTKQWLALGQLIKAKYGSKFKNKDQFFDTTFPNYQQELSKWIGNLLISLSQFDKVNKDFQKALENKTDISNYSFYNIWQITSQIIDNIDYDKYLPSDSKNKDILRNTFDTTLIKECINVYDNIQNKNFATAIQGTLSIIEKVSVFSNNSLQNNIALDKYNIKLEAEGLAFAIDQNKYTFKISGNDLIISNANGTVLDTLKDYIKVQPFLRFVKNFNSDNNYKIVNSISPNFNSDIKKILGTTKFNETVLLQLLKIQSFYEINGYNQEKLVAFLKTENIYRHTNNSNKKTNSDDEIEKIKLQSEEQLLKLASFFGDVLSAKNEQDLANVIDSHALPPTSYKLKRRVAHSIDLNGYVGIQGSRLITNGETSLNNQYTGGITAPIGFAFTWSSSGPKPENWGFTVDLIDLGNIVNHYLVSTEDYSKDVHFSEVFSPAFSGMYSLRKTPFVIFGSIKFLPLKTSKSDAGELINNKTFDATVFSVGVKIDIPLVNLFTREK